MCIVEDLGGGSGTDEKVHIGMVVSVPFLCGERETEVFRLFNLLPEMSYTMNSKTDL